MRFSKYDTRSQVDVTSRDTRVEVPSGPEAAVLDGENQVRAKLINDVDERAGRCCVLKSKSSRLSAGRGNRVSHTTGAWTHGDKASAFDLASLWPRQVPLGLKKEPRGWLLRPARGALAGDLHGSCLVKDCITYA